MIGLLGGSFDPIHCGHLRLALEARQELNLDEVRLIPCGIPPHRAPPVAGAGQRLAMLSAATQDETGLRVDDREITRPGPSYTIDTLESLRAEFPSTPLCLILGMDAFLGLPAWRRWRELLSYAHLAVAHRPGYEMNVTGEMGELLSQHRIADAAGLRAHKHGRIMLWALPALDISSSRIRALTAQGRSVRYLTPDAVCDMISVQHIYSSI
ncbi:MAG: nicotinate-nucleotide adenylyltransferase [Gammaproteobacteria bacterium]|nr:nicotinate-nucleotide adenylyltransferase [Gammaproteobacteria bacterium]